MLCEGCPRPQNWASRWEMKTRQHESRSARGLCTEPRRSQPGAFGASHQLSKCFIRLLWTLPESCGETAETGTGALHLGGRGARAPALEERFCNLTQHQQPCAGPAASRKSCQSHTAASASRGTWKHLKLPTGRPGALRARPT